MSLTFDVALGDRDTRAALRKIANTILSACSEHDAPEQPSLPMPTVATTPASKTARDKRLTWVMTNVERIAKSHRVWAGDIRSLCALMDRSDAPAEITDKNINKVVSAQLRSVERLIGGNPSTTGYFVTNTGEYRRIKPEGAYAVWEIRVAA